MKLKYKEKMFINVALHSFGGLPPLFLGKTDKN